MPADRTTGDLDLLLRVERGTGWPLHAQVEQALRSAIADGRLAAGAALPASRSLAAELDVSRSVVTEAYSQLGAEGYLSIRPRATPRVASGARQADVPRDGGQATGGPPSPAAPVRYDLRPGSPGLDMFPRRLWSRAITTALRQLPDDALDYPAPAGTPRLRAALAAYLGRVRGVRAGAEGPLVCAGVSQALSVAVAALRETGRTVLAVEDPGHADVRRMLAATGVTLAAVPVDDEGLVVEAIPDAAGAVLVTAAHQYPTGVVLSAARRAELTAWARDRDAYVLEDDYDAEFRYDRAPVGALQGLAPDRVVAMGSVSKTLAPALRMGWLTAAPELRATLGAARAAAGHGLGTIEQHAFASLLERGDYDRHVRRSRRTYSERRGALIAALDDAFPDVRPGGIGAGLHLTLPVDDETTALARAAQAGVRVDALGRHRLASTGPSALVLGYGRLPTPAVPAAVDALRRALER